MYKRLFLLIVLSISAQAVAQSDKLTLNYLVIREGVEPFQMVIASEAEGLISDIVYSVVSEMDVNLNVVTLPNNQSWFKELVKEERINWIAFGSPYWFNDSSLSQVEFSDLALFSHNYSVVSKKQGVPRYHNKSSFSGYRLALIKGIKYENFGEYLQDYGTEVNIEEIRYNSTFEAMEALKNDEVDYFLIHRPRGMYLLNEYGIDTEDYNFVYFPDVPTRQIFLMFDKNIPKIYKDEINKRLLVIRDSGRFNGILVKYH